MDQVQVPEMPKTRNKKILNLRSNNHKIQIFPISKSPETNKLVCSSCRKRRIMHEVKIIVVKERRKY